MKAYRRIMNSRPNVADRIRALRYQGYTFREIDGILFNRNVTCRRARVTGVDHYSYSIAKTVGIA